jgi:hypothetical protein
MKRGSGLIAEINSMRKKMLRWMATVEILTGVGNFILAVGYLAKIYLFGLLLAPATALIGLLGLIAGCSMPSAKTPFGTAEILLWICRVLLLPTLLASLNSEYSHHGGGADFRLFLATAILNGSGAVIFLILYLVMEYRAEKGGRN